MITRQRRTAAVVLTMLVVAAGVTSCEERPDKNRGPKWYGAAVTSPHTRTATLLGESTGPYVVKCSGTGDNLTVDVSAPDGWSAVYRSTTNEWTLRKHKGSEVARLTGSPDGVSYLDYDKEKYVVDSEVLTSPPSSWGLGKDLVRINMYIDCAPPQKRVGPPPSSKTLPPPPTPKGPEKGAGTP